MSIYFIFMLRFYLGHPGPRIDYVVKLNARIETIPVPDRAWPLWRNMILATVHPDVHGEVAWPTEFNPSDGVYDWPAIRRWLPRHRNVIETARLAAAKPAMGFILGRGRSLDPELPDANYVRLRSERRNHEQDARATKGNLSKPRFFSAALCAFGDSALE